MTPTTGQQQPNVLDAIINFVKNNQTLQKLFAGQAVPQTTQGIAPTPNMQGVFAPFAGNAPTTQRGPAFQSTDYLAPLVDQYMNEQKKPKRTRSRSTNPQAILAKGAGEE